VPSGKAFAGIIVTSTRYEAIYSGFAIVIIVMFWLYLSWLILLMGSQLAFYVQHPYHLPLPQRTDPLNNELRERLALSIMLLIGRDFERPGHGWRTESLAAELRMPRVAIEPVMAALVEADLVTETSELRLVPARDPRRIAVSEIVSTVRGTREQIEPAELSGWNRTVDDLTRRIEDAIDSVLAGRSLADLVDEDLAAVATPSTETDSQSISA
jgi:membrane protein